MAMQWPWGSRATIENGLIDVSDDQAGPVDLWVCLRLDEPISGHLATPVFIGRCCTCHTEVVYSLDVKNPPLSTPMICTRCVELFHDVAID